VSRVVLLVVIIKCF